MADASQQGSRMPSRRGGTWARRWPRSQRKTCRRALDVWYRYPRTGKAAPAARPFHELPNVLMTPHVSD